MIGHHVSKSAGGKKRLIAEALEEAAINLQSLGFKNIGAQIFVTGPQSFREIMTADDIIKTKKVVKDYNINLVIHGAYVDAPWRRSPGSVHNIKKELNIASEIGANGVIVHLGSGAADDDNLKYVLEQIAADNPQPILWLEIHTAKPSKFTYETTDKIKKLFYRIGVLNVNVKVGLCIDTAHLYACGMALTDYDLTYKWLNQIRMDLPNIPIMMHLNDSGSTLASGKDQHAVLTAGNLWSMYNINTGHLPIEDSGLVAILNWAEDADINVILERDEAGTERDLILIHNLGYFQ